MKNENLSFNDQKTINSSAVEPIAIVGIGCRFPGEINDPKSFWELIAEGKDAIVDIPENRWDIKRFYDQDINKPGKMYVRSGGFLEQDIDQFDSLFFGITPREADCLDPQQRILMEVTWEAFEDAGIPADSLASSSTGVYIGAFTLDNKLTQMSGVNREKIGPHTAVGSTMTILSNRLSYLLDLRGPSISVDTACSSSLVAFHYACESIRTGVCTMAIAGGVNIIHRPEYMIAMCKGQFLSPDGRCKSFDARADGYGRGEGAGIVVLKKLSEAINAGDRIYAVVRGTGVNQDGRTSGITVPNGESQEKLIRQVCANAGVKPTDISYVEAHGTGTPIGDPTEAGAIGRALGSNRSEEEACYISSVKANIGHLEAASGVAGLIKTALCLKKKQIPPLANLQQANPAIPFKDLGLRLPLQTEAMPQYRERALASINSFGYGGTNAHVILEEPPLVRNNINEIEDDTLKCHRLLPFSARSKESLHALANKYLDYLSETESLNLNDVCYSAGLRSTHHEHRLAITFESKDQLCKELKHYLDNQESDLLASSKISSKSPQQPVFVFTGMGPQWWAMGRELINSNELFRLSVEECDKYFQAEAGWSILNEMLATKDNSRITQTHIAQPANLVVQIGILAILDSWGIKPAAIVGHSVGEVSAAYAAGALNLADTIKVSFHRGRIQSQAAGKGKMLAVGLSESDCIGFLSSYQDKVSIAAINSLSALTLAGDSKALDEIANKLESNGIFNRFLKVEVPYHSPAMEPLKPELRDTLSNLDIKDPIIPLYSTVTGERVETACHNAEYWCDNVRKPVLFAKAMETILKDKNSLFIEIGPHPVLSTSIKEAMKSNNVHGSVIATLHREKPEMVNMWKVLAELYTTNSPVAWEKICKKSSNLVQLPHYAWQRETYWEESEEALLDRLGAQTHPLLYQSIPSPDPVWESRINQSMLPYLHDHVVDGVVVLPGAAYVETGLLLTTLNGNIRNGLINLKFHNALVVDDGDEPVFRVHYNEKESEFLIYSRTRDNKKQWTLHATGTIWSGEMTDVSLVNIEKIKSSCTNAIDTKLLYKQFEDRGLQYGPWFQGIHKIRVGTDEVFAEIKAHKMISEETELYQLHPTLLDTCFQALICLLSENQDTAYLPVEIDHIYLFDRLPEKFLVHGTLTNRSDKMISGDLVLFDDNGNRLAEISGLRCQALQTRQKSFESRNDNLFYQFDWKQADTDKTVERNGNWLIFDDRSPLVDKLACIMEGQLLGNISRVIQSDHYGQKGNLYSIRKEFSEDYVQLLEHASDQDGIAYFWGCRQSQNNDLDEIAQQNTSHLLHLLKAIENTTSPTNLRLYVITRGAQQVVESDQMEANAQWPLIGLSRVAFNELPDNHCTLVDINSKDQHVDSNLIVTELLSDSLEDDVALRNNQRFVKRLDRTSIDILEDQFHASLPKKACSNRSYKIVSRRGQVFFQDSVQKLPAPGEIEIELHSVMLNHQDSTRALSTNGIAQEKTVFHEKETAHGFTGFVSRIGNGVDNYNVGDRLVGYAQIELNSFITLQSHSVPLVATSQNSNFCDLATIPESFVPLYYALSDRGRLEAGETLLICGYESEMGLVAAKIGKYLGAKVIVGFDNQSSDTDLDSMNISDVIGSQRISFIQEVKEVTNGKGADIILNLSKTTNGHNLFDALAQFGRLIDIFGRETSGDYILKRPLSISNNLEDNTSYIQVDTASLIDRPELFQRLLGEVLRLIQTKELTSNPLRTFSSNQLQEAFNWLQDKTGPESVILRFHDLPDIPVLPRVEPSDLITPNSSYLITGGFGGFGAQIARWLVENGATQLVLVGRQGAKTPESKMLIEELERKGAKVLGVAADITQIADVERVIDQVCKTMSPLHTILHAAGILDDAPLSDLNEQRLSSVMAPKVKGAWNLHQVTQQIRLKHFVLFSSVSSIIGNARQGNYVAANSFLDALAFYRRSKGLCATSINWGAIASAGMAADNEDVKKHLELMGMNAFSVNDAMEAFSKAAPYEPIQLGIMDVNWRRWAQFEPKGGASPRFIDLVEAESNSENQTSDDSLLDQLHFLEPQARLEMLMLLIAEQVSITLRLPVEKIDQQQSLTDMGMDSLLAGALQIELSARFGIELSLLEIIKGNSISQIAEIALKKLKIETMKPVDNVSNDALDQLLTQLIINEKG